MLFDPDYDKFEEELHEKEQRDVGIHQTPVGAGDDTRTVLQQKPSASLQQHPSVFDRLGPSPGEVEKCSAKKPRVSRWDVAPVGRDKEAVVPAGPVQLLTSVSLARP